MSVSEFYGGATKQIKPNEKTTVLSFLTKINTPCQEAWLLGRASFGGNGPLKVRLVDETNTALSDYVELHSSSLSRILFQNVKIPASPFPLIINVEARNTSSETMSPPAVVDGVMLVYSKN